jgi:hypothetical protein
MKVELANIVWRILHWVILESFISIHQVIVDLLHSSLEQVCVLDQRVIRRGPYNIKALVVISTFIIYNTMICFFPIKLISFYCMIP